MELNRAWHSLEGQAVLRDLTGSESGLDEGQVEERRRRFGRNRLPAPERRGPWRRFAQQFHNILIYVLLVAALVTALLGHNVDAWVITAVVLVNAIIGFVQEGKAEAALDAVSNMLSPKATVIRAGRRLNIDADEIVPGDLVGIQSGDRVPADLRLYSAHELHIDEALLTGESMPVRKQTGATDSDAPLAERLGMAYSGTLVTAGQAYGVVVATATDTEIGQISQMLSKVQTLSTPLTRQMDHFALVLTSTILVIASLTALFGVFARGYQWSEMFLAAVGLAVAAIPEGLPAIITITLAIGVQRMARRNAIIRRLPAVETLGSVSTICSDKTGTLTRNEMTVTHIQLADQLLEVSGEGYDPHGGFAIDGRDVSAGQIDPLEALCQAALLCNDASLHQVDGQWRISGDPTEAALVVMASKAGLEAAHLEETLPRTDVIPFESDYQFMATLHHDHAGEGYLYLKGSPEAILDRCDQVRSAEGDHPLDRDHWHEQVKALAGQGLRTLAIATQATPVTQNVLRFSDVDGGMVLLGVLGIIDPPRETAIDAVARCREAGINVKMITGDHAITARAIASQMGIGRSEAVLAGPEIEQLDDQALFEAAHTTDLFARASPVHKLRLVSALQSHGEVVAMTGDGVNDAPALKRADVGVAMGIKGTEAAKEAAEMVLADDNFASISYAVEEGRTVYDNIKKSILFILPTNGGEALTILAAIALGAMLPVTAAQILWVNMITAVTLALSLAFEPAEQRIMQRQPRAPDAPLLSGYMAWRILFVSLLMVTATFGLFLYERGQGASIEWARTVAVNTLVVAEVFYLLNSRYLTEPVLNRRGLLGNPWVPRAIGLVLLFQLLFTYHPLMQRFFATAPLDAPTWGRIFLAGLMILLLVELEKWGLRSWRRHQQITTP